MALENKQFRCDSQEWENFKEICNQLGSNASVELRKFIKKFNKKHSETLQKTLEELQNMDETLEQIEKLKKALNDPQVQKILKMYDKTKSEEDEVLEYLANN